MMGKYIVMYVIPAFLLLPLVWWGVRQWYLKGFKHTVKGQKEINKATQQYERDLGINKQTPKRKKK